MTASMGVAVYPEDGKTFDDLMKRADVAMYHAKNGGITYLPSNRLQKMRPKKYPQM